MAHNTGKYDLARHILDMAQKEEVKKQTQTAAIK
jgi:hypothetical protein